MAAPCSAAPGCRRTARSAPRRPPVPARSVARVVRAVDAVPRLCVLSPFRAPGSDVPRDVGAAVPAHGGGVRNGRVTGGCEGASPAEAPEQRRRREPGRQPLRGAPTCPGGPRASTELWGDLHVGLALSRWSSRGQRRPAEPKRGRVAVGLLCVPVQAPPGPAGHRGTAGVQRACQALVLRAQGRRLRRARPFLLVGAHGAPHRREWWIRQEQRQ